MATPPIDCGPVVDSFNLGFGVVRVAKAIARLGNGERLPVAPVYTSLAPYGDAAKFLNGLVATGWVEVKGDKNPYLQITDAGRLALIVFYTGG